jgi:murein DD-endopeptidase MepM/ murein hydrolase activator NlpD
VRVRPPEGLSDLGHEEIVSEEEPSSRSAFPPRLAIAALAILLIVTTSVLGIGAAIFSSEDGVGSGGLTWSEFALRTIPEEYIELFDEAELTECPGLAPQWLAAIAKVETDMFTNIPTSSAGAEGPMQFMPATWTAYGIDGDGDGDADIMSIPDAVYSAAAFLCANAAPADMRSAVFAYNHSEAYVDTVISWEEKYTAFGGGLPFSICPVDPPRSYSDDFGAPRFAGGYHPHRGNDILAPGGTPIRAPFSGTAYESSNDLGGLAVTIEGPAGHVYNAHLSAIGALGPVSAGTVVGYVGSTGDVIGGPAHDHFEWHPAVIPTDPWVSPYGFGVIDDAIDPYPYLNAVCGLGGSGASPAP